MKTEFLAGFFIVVFAAGIGVGALLFGGKKGSSTGPVAQGAKQTGKQAGNKTVINVQGDTNKGAQAGQNGSSKAGASGLNGQGPGLRFTATERSKSSKAVVDPRKFKQPEHLSADMLNTGEKIKREIADRKGKGNAEVTALVYDFKSKEERDAWERQRRRNWQARRKHEIDVKIRQLKEKVGLTDGQAQQVKKILDKEDAERTRLVDLLTSKQISRGDFQQFVQANVKTAYDQLSQVLSPSQMTVYKGLKPREQVLREETK